MSDPRRQEVSKTSAKKSEVVDRTTSERKYCAIDQFYYSEMFTCPICYGVEQERERIIKLLEDEVRHDFPPIIEMSLDNLKALIKGEQK